MMYGKNIIQSYLAPNIINHFFFFKFRQLALLAYLIFTIYIVSLVTILSGYYKCLYWSRRYINSHTIIGKYKKHACAYRWS